MKKHHGISIIAALGSMLAAGALAEPAASPAKAPSPPPVERAQPSPSEPIAQPSSRSQLTQLESDGIELATLPAERVQDLQRKLKIEGYYTAAIDGVPGGQTRQALRQFYSDQAQLAAKGMILPEGAEALGLDLSQPVSARPGDTERPQ